MMRFIYLILSIITFISCSNTVTKQKVPGLIVKTELKGCYRLPQFEGSFLINGDSIIYFLVDFKIINKSEQSIEFITYSCTSVENIVVNNKSVRLLANRCSGNGPMLVELKPMQSFSLPIIIQTNIKNAFTNIIDGWIYIDKVSESIYSFHDIYKLLTKKKANLEDVIWSDSLYLDASGGKPFEVL